MNSLSPRNPVLLIHGIWDTTAIFSYMTTALSQQGWLVYSLNLLPNDGRAGLNCLADQLASFIEQTFDPEQPLDIVGYSMGGLVSRYYIQRLGGYQRVQRFITISSPHHGTLAAYSLPLPGYVQMRPGSLFLRDLNQDLSALEQLNFTSIWTPLDAIIVPASSSQMPIGDEVKLNIWFHRQMVSHPLSLQAIVIALAAPLKHPKSQSECTLI